MFLINEMKYLALPFPTKRKHYVLFRRSYIIIIVCVSDTEPLPYLKVRV